MVKRNSRESNPDKNVIDNVSDRSPINKRRRYNLRDRKPDSDQEPPSHPPDTDIKSKKKRKQIKEEVLWINDDTLTDRSSESEYTPSQPENTFVINICIHNSDSEETDDDESSEEEDEPSSHKSDTFLMSLLEKYASANNDEPDNSKKGKSSQKIPMKLTQSENKYFKSLNLKTQKTIIDLMQRVIKIGFEDGDIPYKFKILQLPISDYMKCVIIKKANALADMPPDSGESYKLKNWIDGLLRIPFGKTIPLPVKLDDGREKSARFMKESKDILDKAIYGMDGAKIQIMQIISQWVVNPSSVGNVIALQGPMGVGKTSFAKNAIAKVLNRPFEFFSLGGASDISNFIGHSYTYEGSVWGRIADSLMHSGTMNPVFYFDELDKISTTPHGEEITNMLIHLTDRSQNTQFHDRYFSGIEFDLSQCLFVFSLNDIERVHPILRDRMTIISCGGYNEKDKKEILKNYVWPQTLEQLKFKDCDVEITDDGMKFLISEFSADEKGVRTLIRTVETMMTRLNMLRIADVETMKDYTFFMDVSFPLKIDESVMRILLSDTSKKDLESWKTMYC